MNLSFRQAAGQLGQRSERVARALSVHGAIGLAVAALLYLLALSGVLSLFNHELQRWEQPGAPEMPQIDAEAVARGAAAALAIQPARTAHLYVNYPLPDLPRTVVTTDHGAHFIDAEGRLAGVEQFPWTQFLLDLHYYLHLPTLPGLTLVGALGALLLGLVLSGLLAHPRIFRDAFTLRRGAGRLTTVDLHNRLAVWSAPFHIVVALTGAMLGLATLLAILLAGSGQADDVHAVFEPVFGEEHPVDLGEAPLADLAAVQRAMQDDHGGVPLHYLIVHDPATRGQQITAIGRPQDRLIFGEYYHFGTQGRFLGNTGLAQGKLSQQLAASVYGLHFGDWGGLPVKLVYALLGSLLAVVIASGPRIWLARQRARGLPRPRWESAWSGVLWGAPLALAGSLLAAVSGVSAGWILVVLFWVLLVVTTSWAAHAQDAVLVGHRLRLATGCALLLGVLVHALRSDGDSLGSAGWAVSLCLVLTAVALLLPLRHSPLRQRRPALDAQLDP